MSVPLELWLHVVTPEGSEHPLAVQLGPEAACGDLAQVLAAHLGVRHAVRLHVARLGLVVEADAAVTGSGIRTGDRLELTTQPSGPTPRHRLVLAVTGGPAAGTHFPLPAGDHAVGRDAACDVAVPDPSMSKRHAAVRVGEAQVLVADAGSSNGTFLNGTRVAAPISLAPGDRVECGHTTLELRVLPEPAAPAAPSGTVAFNRPPRMQRASLERIFKLPAPPSRPGKRRLPMTSALGPLVLGIPLVAYGAIVGNQMMLVMGVVSAVFSPLLALGSFVEDRRGGRHQFEADLEAFYERLAATSDQMSAALAEERAERHLRAPDLATLVERVDQLAPDLWERRPASPDFLHVRLGTADQPSAGSFELSDGGEDDVRAEAVAELGRWAVASNVPVVIDLPHHGVVGLAGDDGSVAGAARAIAVQIAATHSPRDVVMAMAVGAAERQSWEWAWWLPHLRSEVSPINGQHLAVGDSAAAALFDAVSAVVAARRVDLDRRLSRALLPSPAVVLFVSEELRVPRTAITSVLEGGAAVGVFVVWLGRTPEALPGECGAVVELQAQPVACRLTEPAAGRRTERAVADLATVPVAAHVARSLAGVKDVSTGGTRGQIPRSVALLELLGLDTPTPTALLARWRAAERGVAAPVGIGAAGTFLLDMRRDGPHALVGGTTGAGKSELLQTFVAALAACHPPEQVTFLLVDYKGGAAFKDAVSLPHTVGFVTDLDGHLVSRVLVSLNAELHRRERLLRDHDAKDLFEMERRLPHVAPPSLLLIVDEFATLAKELPEFVDGVVNVAQRGRSLGIHLILATQRPAGAINDNVRANTNLRIALRMNDVMDSEDVIGAKDAALLPRSLPGRAFVRTGQAELSEVQIAYAGGRSGASASGAREVVVRELRDGVVVREARQAEDVDGESDLQLLVRTIQEAALEAGLPPQPQPWLPPLADVVPLRSLAHPPGDEAVLGVVDLPQRQAQEIWTWHPEREGSLLVYGTSGTGKTTLLRTIAASLAERNAPDDLHIYGLDFASRGLAPLEALPHVGSVVPGDDVERVQRLITTVTAEIVRRRDLFADAGVSTLSEYRRNHGRHLPRLVVLLDGYGSFTAAFDRIDFGEWIERVPRLVAEGRALGVHFVITADRRTAVSMSLSGSVTSRVVFRMAEDDEYASLGLDARTARTTALPAGRGFVDATVEFHAAVVGHDPSGEAQVEAVTQLGGELHERHPHTQAPPVRSLPSEVDRASMPLPDELMAAVGIGQRELAPVLVDLREGNLLVAGPNRSGRSTALATIALSLAASTPGVELVLLAPRRSPLTSLHVWQRSAKGLSDCEDLAREIEETIDDRDGSEPPLVVVVDDGTELVDSRADSSIERIVRRGRDVGIYVIGAAESTSALRSYSGWVPEIRKDRRAILLNPDPDIDGDLVAVKLPRRAGPGLPPGRGYLATDGGVELVQCAS